MMDSKLISRNHFQVFAALEFLISFSVQLQPIPEWNSCFSVMFSFCMAPFTPLKIVMEGFTNFIYVNVCNMQKEAW